MAEQERHECHAIGCREAVPPRLLMCRRHWSMVPKHLKNAVWAHYEPGQEVTKTPSSDYLRAASAAIQFVADRERAQRDSQPRLL